MSQPSREEFITVFRSIFQDGTGIASNTEFRNLEEWSSMQALLLIAAIDEHFGVTIPERDFRQARTVADLHQLIVS